MKKRFTEKELNIKFLVLNLTFTKRIRYLTNIIAIIILVGCSNKTTVEVHDAKSPIVIEKITPSNGSMASDVLIYGNNFSPNKEEIQVSINGKNAEVIGSTMNIIYVVVPKRPDNNGVVYVTINSQKSNEVPFTYITSESAQSLAGTGASGDVEGDGEKSQFNFSDLTGLCLSPEGNVIVADCGNNKIKEVSISTGKVKTLISGLNKPTDVVYDKDGNLFIANCDGMSILRYGKDKVLTKIATMDWPTALAYDDVTDKIFGVLYAGGNIMVVKNKNATSEENNIETYFETNGINVSFMTFKDGDLYFTSSNKHAIYKINKETKKSEVIAGVEGEIGITEIETDAKTAKLTNPCGLCFGPNGDLYFTTGLPRTSTSTDNRILVLRKKDNQVSPVIGKKNAGNADGSGSSALFNCPVSIKVDKDNTSYVLDKLNYKIRKITIQ